MRILPAALCLVAFALAGCSDGTPQGGDGASTPSPPGQAPGAAAPATHGSVMRGNRFEPADLTVRVGDTVRWTTEDVQAHNVVSQSEAASFRSEDISLVAVPGTYATEFSYTFDRAGTVDYLCEYHGGMVGTITVVGDGSSS